MYTALVKGMDRIDNLSSMVNVFSPEKQHAYIEETEEFVTPLIDKAKFKFPQEEKAFRMIKHSLLLMIDMWKGLNGIV